MTRTFKTIFTNIHTGNQIEVITKVTDRMEERGDNHKKAFAIEKAHRKFEAEHIRFVEIEETGEHRLLWNDETFLVK